MKKQEIELNACYRARVNRNFVTVRIVRESPYGGWYAVNLATGRTVRIRTAGRLSRLHPADQPQE